MHTPRPALRLTAMLALLAVTTLLVMLPPSASARARALGKGQATVTLDTYFVLFVGGGFPIYPSAPATMHFGLALTPKLIVPIGGGTWDTVNARGTFLLKGGVDYIHYTSGPPLALHRLLIVKWHAGVNTTEGWTGQANGSRITIFDENLMGSHPSFFKRGGHRYVKVNDVILTYDTAFSTAFNNTFGTTITPGTPFGTATLVAQLK